MKGKHMKAISTSRLRDNLLKALAVTAVAAVPGAAFAPAALAAPSTDPTDLSIPSGCDLELAGGSGTYTDPFQIRNERQLSELNDCGTDGDYLYYELENDIELVSDDSKDWNDDEYGWDPIGYSSEGDAFTGNFNGNGYTISGMRVNQWLWGNQIGLFGTTDGATIKNLTVEGNIVTNGYDDVGGLVGEAYGDTHITNVHTDVLIDGDDEDSDNVGGIIGYADGVSVNNSTSAGDIVGYNGDSVGGIIGYGEYFTAYKVSSSSQIGYIDNDSDGNEYTGGILGEGYYGTVSDATFSGSVTGYYYVGGIVGYGDSVSINNSAVTEDGLVQAEFGTDTWEIGGIAGHFEDGGINNVSFAGEIDANQDTDTEIGEAGGIVGYFKYASVSNATVEADAVLGFSGDGDSSYEIGGIVGYGYEAAVSSSTNNAYIEVYDAEYVGGIIGFATDGTSVTRSVNNGDVQVWTDTDADNYVGGVAGYIDDGGSITASANKGDVDFEGDTYTYDVGGLAGYATEASITDSYNLGSVQGNEDVAGLIGWASSETDINTSYNAGYVEAWDDYQDGIANGDWADSTSNVVLDTDVSAGSDTNINQWATSQVQDASALADLGWSIDEADATWAIDADYNDGYPYLAYEYTAAPVPVADVTFAAVKFSTKKSVALSANAQAYLTLVAEQILSDDFARVEVNGYTNRHTRKSVASARTAAVVAFLEDAGVSVEIDVHNNLSAPGHVRNTVVVSALG